MRIGSKHPHTAAPSRSASAAAAVVAPAKPATDVRNIVGISEAELTPKVRETLLELMSEIDRLRQEMEAARRRLQEVEAEADLDPLVPALNRRAFVRELSRTISYSERYNASASLIYFDVNHFKEVNDKFGHGGGDMALLHVAGRLAENIRESDILGRLGGDEFGVILVQADEETAIVKAQQLCQAISKTPAFYEGREIFLSATPGMSTFRSGDDAATALMRADEAMYRQKREAVKTGANPRA
jgi:diguanylate cyclase (GGDEF)-like protein